MHQLESVLLLGIAVLLYGLWLYRDASYSVLHRLSISRKRMILGLWHLIFVPLVIIQIFDWGSQIDWFEVYVLQETFILADFAVPTIMLTIFVTYVSSIVIVVVNLYREISKGLSRLTHMAKMGTPPLVVEEECVQL